MEDQLMNYLLIALIWTAYCFQHSYLICVGVTEFMKRKLNSYYAFYRLFYVIISVILLITVLYYGGKLQSEIVFEWTPPWNYIRYALILASLFVFLKSFFFDYDSLAFMGLRQIINFQSKAQKPHRTAISKKGLLGIVRHPMYLAAIVLLWCNTRRVSDIVVNAVLTGYFFIGTLLEERKLLMEFGEEYSRYQQDVPMLVPFLRFRWNRS